MGGTPGPVSGVSPGSHLWENLQPMRTLMG